MFDKNKFAQILKNISGTYSSQRDFSKKSGINRTYLSQYINLKLDEPPKPSILQKLADSSHGIITYRELMNICGYIDSYISSDIRDLLISLYEQQNQLEEKYKNRGKKLTIEELRISQDLFPQILSCLHDKKMTPENFNPEKILEGIDFIPEKSRKKILKDLTDTFNYFYEKDFLRKEISTIKWENSNYYKDFIQKNENKFKSYKSDIAKISPDISFYMCPVYGQISAGQPNWAEECIEGRLPIDPDLMGIVNPEEHFFLRVNGESMNNIVKNGAFALIHKQDMVEDGEIAVVLVNGYDATLKRFTKKGDVVVLEPDSNDPSFKTQIYDKTTPIKILGKYVGKMEINN